MNWKELFNILIQHNQLDNVLDSISKNEVYQKLGILIEPLKKGEIKGVRYDFGSNKMFAITLNSESITVGHHFFLKSIKSQKLHQELLNNKGTSFTFFDFQFLLYMHQAADVSAGFGHFRNSVKQISQSFEQGKANLDGIELSNDKDLDEYLTKSIHGYKSLFISVEKIKNYT